MPWAGSGSPAGYRPQTCKAYRRELVRVPFSVPSIAGHLHHGSKPSFGLHFLNSNNILTRMYITDMIMRVSKWGNSLAVRLPKSLVNDLGLKSGDELEVVSAKSSGVVVARDERRAKAVRRMRARALSLPEGYVFDRNEANAR